MHRKDGTNDDDRKRGCVFWGKGSSAALPLPKKRPGAPPLPRRSPQSRCIWPLAPLFMIAKKEPPPCPSLQATPSNLIVDHISQIAIRQIFARYSHSNYFRQAGTHQHCRISPF